ncbi:LacI family transcriptional regulator [Hahella sp. CR1]|uniref:LacI family DNA-binding transcriptional regulator n=1 Tax=Hahella sp. CR1 TaxID=2992807 RepID=UPI00244265A0|nr:LacI family DNA-binding transcriptional regulator [Hahella sp. CR1]MDG9666627.1 LacI family transcriptional regulator [Hahella sp. CR1]
MPTIIDVSELAHVSKSTVSRVVSNKGSVSPAARKRVEDAIRKLGYRPNHFARGLKSNKSDIIGVVVVNLASPFYAQMLSGVQDYISGSDKHLVVTSGYGDLDREVAVINSLLDRRCDGLLLYVENEVPLERLAGVHPGNYPIVTMGRMLPGISKWSARVDNLHGGYLAARYLLEKGHRRIAHLMGPESYLDARLRRDGFLRAMAEHGLTERDYLILSGPYEETFGYQATLRLLDGGARFTAICAGDDDMAAGVYQALRERGVSVPEQISVVGYDDNFHAKLMCPALTTVRQDVMEMGEAAVKLLIERLENPTMAEKHVVLEPKLIERDSVRDLN